MNDVDDDEPRFEGYDPPENRHIVFANDDGKLYDFEIVSFVILQTSRFLAGDTPHDELDIDELTTLVTETMGKMAQVLSLDGWFTIDEYLDAFAKIHAEDIDEEFRDLLRDES